MHEKGLCAPCWSPEVTHEHELLRVIHEFSRVVDNLSPNGGEEANGKLFDLSAPVKLTPREWGIGLCRFLATVLI